MGLPASSRGSPCMLTRNNNNEATQPCRDRLCQASYHGQAVISLGQPRFVTSAAPFPFPDWRRQPLVPVSRQVPEHPAALPHWPSHLAHTTIGEDALSAPSTWFRCRGVLLAHPRHPGTAMVRERREIFLSLSQRGGEIRHCERRRCAHREHAKSRRTQPQLQGAVGSS